MAYEELFKKIKDYESKWGKLGAGNSILNPEKTTISHSGLNSSNDFYGGKRKMLNMTNDYYEFRRKVAEGKKNNKLAHAATVDIDEINRQHWERINSDGTLIHVGGRYVPNYEEDEEYLEHADRNVKYYQKIKLPNGQTRYFYTREEWDAYQNGQKQSEAESKRNPNGTMKDTAKRALEIPMRTTKDIIKSNQAAKRMAEKNNEYTNDEGERYSTYESRQTKKEITGPNATKSKRIKHSFEDNDMNESIMSEYRAFKARADRGAEMNRLTHSSFISPSELNERYEEEIASHCFLAHAGGYGAPSGTNAYVAKIDDFYGKGKPRYFYSREEYDAYQRNAKGAQNAEKDKGNAITENTKRKNEMNLKRTAYNKKKELENFKYEPDLNPGSEEYNTKARYSGYNTEKERKESGNVKKNNTAGIETSVKSNDPKEVEKIVDSKEIKSIIGYFIDDYINSYSWTSKDDPIKKNTKVQDNLKEIKNGATREILNNIKVNNADRGYLEKLIKEKIDKELDHKINLIQAESDTAKRKNETATHSFEDNDENTIEHSALDELNEFKAKVAMGKEKNRLAHSRMISLTELQHAAQNWKYYNKIDLGNGNTRYFYTKAEWDAYQQGKSDPNMKSKLLMKTAADADKANKAYAKSSDQHKNDDSAQYSDYQKYLKEQQAKKKLYENNAKAASQAGADRAASEVQSARNAAQIGIGIRNNAAAASQAGADRASKEKYNAQTNPLSAALANNLKVTPEEILEAERREIGKKATIGREQAEKKGHETASKLHELNEANIKWENTVQEYNDAATKINEKYFSDAKTTNEIEKASLKLVKDLRKASKKIEKPDNMEIRESDTEFICYIPEIDKELLTLAMERDKLFNDSMNSHNYEESVKIHNAIEEIDKEMNILTVKSLSETYPYLTTLFNYLTD